MDTDIIQTSLFPELEKEDEQTLFILGNGFDLAHTIKSSFWHFRDWSKDNKGENLVNLMDIFFSNETEVWGNVEKALGEYDEDSIIEFCRPEEEIDYEHTMRSVAAIEDSPDWIFKPILDDFSEAFEEWIESINLNDINKIFKSLPASSKYLTFNYTETLEKLYGIPKENVLHIHGSRLLKDGYIFGHCKPRDPDKVYDNSDLYFMQDTRAKIIKWMNEMEKDSKFIISRHRDFFEGLSHINKVIVYGHSFNEADWPYLIEVIKSTDKSAIWLVSYHTSEDLDNINKFIMATGFKNITTFYL